MANVISIEGSHGVGKTTLVRNLKQKFTEAFFYDEQGIKELQLKKEQSKYRMHVESEFYEIQKWYIQHEIDRFNYLGNQDLVFVVRGPEMKEFYILQYPKTIGKNWDVETNLQPWLTKLRSCRSSKILFLDATIQNLKERIERSGRPRKNIEDWFDIWYQPYTTFFMNHSNSFIVDTNTLNDLIVKQIVSDWILNSATD